MILISILPLILTEKFQLPFFSKTRLDCGISNKVW